MVNNTLRWFLLSSTAGGSGGNAPVLVDWAPDTGFCTVSVREVVFSFVPDLRSALSE